MPNLTPEQQRIRDRIVSIGKRRGATPKEIKAALETGLVESNLRNLPGGDADSAGWRQERASLYKDPTNLTASINRFYDETSKVRDQYKSSGALAAAVQRPAAQYRGRYQQRAGEAGALLSGGGTADSGGATTTPGSTRTTKTQRLISPAINNAAARASLVYNFLSPGSGRQKDLTGFVSQAQQLEDVPAQYATDVKTTTTPGTTTPGAAGGSDGLTASATERASAINAQQLPYRWGGGHAGKTPLHQAIPLDCSGAVSKVLGIDPRVSSDFQKWGRAGDGGNKGVTVYSNPHHVLMKIDGHFFGTSAANPGGGAGWIPQQHVSPQYLQNFTARHSAR